MADMIQIRRDAAANWTTANPILAQGELGAETDTSKIKIGNGSSAWSALSYLIDAGDYLTASATTTLTNKTITYADNVLSGVVGTTATQTLTNKTIDYASNTLTGVVGTTATQTLTNKTFTGYTETVFALGTSGSQALNPANGTVQTCAASAAVTFTDSLASGQSIVLMLTNGATYTVNYPAITWVGPLGNVAPTLNAANTLVFWKVVSTLYGAVVGKYA
jgi:hypothetical protein